MKNYTLQQRADFYNKAFPKYSKQAWLSVK